MRSVLHNIRLLRYDPVMAKGIGKGLLGIRGHRHPRAMYSRETRALVLTAIRNRPAQRVTYQALSDMYGVPVDTIGRWWRAFEAMTSRQRAKALIALH
jgi:hypothetical protein